MNGKTGNERETALWRRDIAQVVERRRRKAANRAWTAESRPSMRAFVKELLGMAAVVGLAVLLIALLCGASGYHWE